MYRASSQNVDIMYMQHSYESSLGMRTLCRNNFRNNRMQKESGITLE